MISRRKTRIFYNKNRAYILAITFIISFVIGFIAYNTYKINQLRNGVAEFTQSSVYNKADNTNTFDNSEVDSLLDTFGLDH